MMLFWVTTRGRSMMLTRPCVSSAERATSRLNEPLTLPSLMKALSALVLMDRLLERGVRLQVHDPEAMENVRKQYGDRIIYAAQPMDVLENADALAINTEWGEFRNPDFREMKRRMAKPVVFDGRNLYDRQHMLNEGFIYYSIGRTPVVPG